MSIRDVNNWKHVLKGKSTSQIAEFLIADMTGYRATSQHRKEDITSLDNAIRAIVEIQPEG
jgi:hypothetical protein